MLNIGVYYKTDVYVVYVIVCNTYNAPAYARSSQSRRRRRRELYRACANATRAMCSTFIFQTTTSLAVEWPHAVIINLDKVERERDRSAYARKDCSRLQKEVALL